LSPPPTPFYSPIKALRSFWTPATSTRAWWHLSSSQLSPSRSDLHAILCALESVRDEERRADQDLHLSQGVAASSLGSRGSDGQLGGFGHCGADTCPRPRARGRRTGRGCLPLVVDIRQVKLASAGGVRGCFVAKFDWYVLIVSVIESVLRCYDHLLGVYL
jgi:hypothetical protein